MFWVGFFLGVITLGIIVATSDWVRGKFQEIDDEFDDEQKLANAKIKYNNLLKRAAVK